MSDRSIVTCDEIKTALLYYAHTHSGYTLMNLGSRLFMVHKDEDGNPAETLDITFKVADLVYCLL